MPFQTPFQEATESREVKRTVLSPMTSKDWRDRVSPEVRERSMFSARVMEAEFLSHAAKRLKDLSVGVGKAPGDYANQATIRLELKDILARTEYQPPEGKAGGMQDLSSDQRLNLIIETNERMAHGYGQWAQGQDEDVLDAFPCQELVRIMDRKEKRDWYARWQAAGGKVFPGSPEAGGALSPDGSGRCIAPINDPIWEAISYFGLPYPPFDFNSGIDVLTVDRETAEGLGVIEPGRKIEPESRGFNDGLEANPQGMDPEIQAELIDALGDDYEEGPGGVIRFVGGGE